MDHYEREQRGLISVAQASELARVSCTAIRRAYRAGDLPGMRGGAEADVVLLDPVEVRAWARARRYIA